MPQRQLLQVTQTLKEGRLGRNPAKLRIPFRSHSSFYAARFDSFFWSRPPLSKISFSINERRCILQGHLLPRASDWLGFREMITTDCGWMTRLGPYAVQQRSSRAWKEDSSGSVLWGLGDRGKGLTRSPPMMLATVRSGGACFPPKETWSPECCLPALSEMQLLCWG